MIYLNLSRLLSSGLNAIRGIATGKFLILIAGTYGLSITKDHACQT